MSISVIRKYTDEDNARVCKAAERFCKRRGIAHDETGDFDAFSQANNWIYCNPSHEYAWQKALCRALRVRYDRDICIAYGYVGYSTK